MALVNGIRQAADNGNVGPILRAADSAASGMVSNRRRKSRPFAHYVKGVFFFLVCLFAVSTLSPLILLQRLIAEEERQMTLRLWRAGEEARRVWHDADDSVRLVDELRRIARQNSLRRFSIAAYTPAAGPSGWRHVWVDLHAIGITGGDTLLPSPPPQHATETRLGEVRLRTLAINWASTPVVLTAVIPAAQLAALQRQRDIELWVRGGTLLAFLAFCWMFYRSVILPFQSMRRRANALVATGVLPPQPGGTESDPEYVMETFDTLVARLLEQAQHLRSRAADSERHARDLEQFNDYILRSLSTGVMIVGHDGDILRFNRAAEEILKCDGAAMIGCLIDDVPVPQPLVSLCREALGESITYARRELEIPRPVPEGTLYLGVNTSLIRNEQQDVIGVSILLTDLTNIRVLEREMADRQRLADLGGMAAGLAHQLRNSIAAILGYGKMLRREASGRAKETDWADAIVQETMETSDMVTRFLEFARPLEGDRSTVELMEVLGDAIEVCRPVLLQHGTRVIEPTVHSRADHRIEGDALLLKQVFVNLLQNAAEAAGPEGVVHIEADERLADDGANRRVVVRVRDNGPGIPDDVRADLFQPFFTTKETGTGLGLALAKKIITHHGGSLCLLHSGPTGTVFEVSLPAIRAKTTAASSAAHV